MCKVIFYIFHVHVGIEGNFGKHVDEYFSFIFQIDHDFTDFIEKGSKFAYVCPHCLLFIAPCMVRTASVVFEKHNHIIGCHG